MVGSEEKTCSPTPWKSWLLAGTRCALPSAIWAKESKPRESRRAGEGARITASIKGLAGRSQPDPLAGADHQCTHDEPVVTESKVSPSYSLGGDAGVDHGG